MNNVNKPSFDGPPLEKYARLGGRELHAVGERGGQLS